MRILLQRVSSASVITSFNSIASIDRGLLVFVGITEIDHLEDIDWLVGKIIKMRIFEDDAGRMNRSVIHNKGEILVISQFTLHASTKKGNRPSFLKAAKPEISEPLYEKFCAQLSQALGHEVSRGVFGADMKISLVNDGPVTIWLDSHARE